MAKKGVPKEMVQKSPPSASKTHTNTKVTKPCQGQNWACCDQNHTLCISWPNLASEEAKNCLSKSSFLILRGFSMVKRHFFSNGGLVSDQPFLNLVWFPLVNVTMD